MADTSTQPFADFSSVSAGAIFHRVDLHIHSFGGSRDVVDATMTPRAIVAKAADQGIRLIALADHNSVANVEALLEATEASGGTVEALAGVEITTSQGHVLVYCGPERLEDLRRLLDRLDFREDEQGDLYTRRQIEDIAADAEAFKGITIPAHVGRTNTGFLTKAPHRDCQAIFESPRVLAVELDDNREVEWFTAADHAAGCSTRRQYMAMRAKALEGQPAATRLARLLFSDAHTLDAVGTARDGTEKLTRIKMERPSFNAFVAALRDPDARVVLEKPLPDIYPRIVGIRYVGGFLDGEQIAFAPNLTALIGGRGAGKSTAIEAMRCACQGGASDIEGSEAWPESVQIEYVDSFGARHFLQRDAGAETAYEILDDGTAVPMENPLEGYEQDRIAAIIRSSDKEPRLLLAFLDRFVASETTSELQRLKGLLKDNATELLPIAESRTALKNAEQDLATARGRIQIAAKTKAKDALDWRRLLHSERQLRDAVEDAIRELEESEAAVPVDFDLDHLANDVGIEDVGSLPASAVLAGSGSEDTLAKVLGELSSVMTKWKQSGVRGRATIRTRLDAVFLRWDERDKTVEARIQRIIAALREEGINPDLGAINALASAENQAQRRVTKLRQEVATLKRLTSDRASLLVQYRHAQQRRTTDRTLFGKRVAQQFKDAHVEFSVGIKFREGKIVDEYEGWLRERLQNRFLRGERITEFCDRVHPHDLAEWIRVERPTKLLPLTDERGSSFFASVGEARAFLSHLRTNTEAVMALELIAPDDRPDLSLTQSQEGKSRTYPFRDLSFGQRASILLGIVLFSEEMQPLVIDQPEDHLDSAFIYDAVVQTLRRVKERRQVIVATHNANIAVLGDAELVVPLRSWAGRGRVTDRGSVDNEATRKRACRILEGGEDAYRRRGEMYGLA